MNDEQQIEQELQEKNLNAPRVKPEHIDDVIYYAHYYSPIDGVTDPAIMGEDVYKALSLITKCTLVLANGFTVTGESACASPENFDPEIGRKLAYEDARNKVWPLMGFLLKEHLHRIKLQQEHAQA